MKTPQVIQAQGKVSENAQRLITQIKILQNSMENGSKIALQQARNPNESVPTVVLTSEQFVEGLGTLGPKLTVALQAFFAELEETA